MKLQQAGPFTILPEGVDHHYWAQRRSYVFQQPSCDYCKRLYAGGEVMCEGCGAPRRETGSIGDHRVMLTPGEMLLAQAAKQSLTICTTS